MNHLSARRLTLMGLIGYASLAAILTLLPASLPVTHEGLPYVFALEAVVLAAGGLYIWNRAHRLVAAMAYRDDLTTLGNRRAFSERTAHIGIESRGGSLGIVLFDVDGLKGINEDCGHQAGDELLAIVGRRLGDLKSGAYRIGGDEFAVIIDRNAGQTALPVLQRLEPFQAPFDTCGHSHEVRLSFGFASAIKGESFHDLFARADQRLRQFKRDLYTKGTLSDRRRLQAEAAEMDEALPEAVGATGKRTRGRLRLLG